VKSFDIKAATAALSPVGRPQWAPCQKGQWQCGAGQAVEGGRKWGNGSHFWRPACCPVEYLGRLRERLKDLKERLKDLKERLEERLEEYLEERLEEIINTLTYRAIIISASSETLSHYVLP
jgi:hypothetical protein